VSNCGASILREQCDENREVKTCGRVLVKSDHNARRLLPEIEINEDSFGTELVSWSGQYVKCGAASRILEFQPVSRNQTTSDKTAECHLREPTCS